MIQKNPRFYAVCGRALTSQATYGHARRHWYLCAVGRTPQKRIKHFPSWVKGTTLTPYTIPLPAGLVCTTHNVRGQNILINKLGVLVVVAVAHRLHSFVGNPRLGSPRPQRHVEWELDHVLLSPLRIIGALVGTHVVSNGLAGIEPLVADALCLVQKFLRGMDWNTPERKLERESSSFGRILEVVSRIHVNEQTRILITPFLVEALERTCWAGMCIIHRYPAIFSPLTSHTVAQAATESLRASVNNPRLGSPHPQRHVEWELDNVILPPLRIIGALVGIHAVSNGLAGIEQIGRAHV